MLDRPYSSEERCSKPTRLSMASNEPATASLQIATRNLTQADPQELLPKLDRLRSEMLELESSVSVLFA
jgi:hypothetical protein